MDFILQQQQQNNKNNNHDGVDDTGSAENQHPYIPKYSMKDESLLRRVDLNSMEVINAVFFPDEYQNGEEHWISVPKHILGVDTDFSFVIKKVEEFRNLAPAEQQRESARWDKMKRWERNMYEDRIAILMQQRALLVSQYQASNTGSDNVGFVDNTYNNNNVNNVLMSRITCHKRNRDFELVVAMQPGPSPTSAGGATPMSMSMANDPFGISHAISNYSEVPDSKRRCLRMKPPIPSRFQGDMEEQKDVIVPEFISLMNFPSLTLPDNLRCCVMCGQACPTSAAMKQQKQKMRTGSKSNAEIAFIPTQNKGLCTNCDVNVWIVASSGMEIKWCKGCKNFRCWASFGDKGHATKCMRCRERQREKYAAQKEEKEKSLNEKSPAKSKSSSSK